MGLGEEARFARHRSLGHGDIHCLDVLYPVSEGTHRFGEIPKEMMEKLSHLSEPFSRTGISFNGVGFSEGTLYFRVEGTHLCGPGRNLLLDQWRRKVGKDLPNIHLVDITPRSVFEERQEIC
jgi:hypothetical protein